METDGTVHYIKKSRIICKEYKNGPQLKHKSAVEPLNELRKIARLRIKSYLQVAQMKINFHSKEYVVHFNFTYLCCLIACKSKSHKLSNRCYGVY